MLSDRSQAPACERHDAEPSCSHSTIEAPRIRFRRGGHEFAVCEVWLRAEGRFAGYCDGKLSLTADRPDVAARALIRKHVTRLPVPKLVGFQAARDRKSYTGRCV